MTKYFFIHIPKTGGTSFRKMLQKQFNEEDIFPNEKLIRKNKGYPFLQELNTLYAEKISDASLFMGHYPMSTYHLFSEETKLLTFFRDPFQRACSFLRYYKKRDLRYKKSSLEDIFNSEINQLSNMQVKIISSIFDDNYKYRVNIAVENLNKLDFFGISEDFRSSIKIAEKKFNWNLGSIKKVNVTKSDIEIPSSIIDKIINCNQEDLMFYEIVKEKFAIQKDNFLS